MLWAGRLRWTLLAPPQEGGEEVCSIYRVKLRIHNARAGNAPAPWVAVVGTLGTNLSLRRLDRELADVRGGGGLSSPLLFGLPTRPPPSWDTEGLGDGLSAPARRQRSRRVLGERRRRNQGARAELATSSTARRNEVLRRVYVHDLARPRVKERHADVPHLHSPARPQTWGRLTP